MKIIFSKECLEYGSPGHPESAQRLRSSFEYLKEKGFEFMTPVPASEEEILLAHSPGLLERIKNADFFDPDTPAFPQIFHYAALSAGAAIKAMELSLKGTKAFSLMRPPGHHAAKDNLAGFCYFNNLAIATKKAIQEGKRAAILDIDCHHGNGTQDIFLNQKDTLYISLHQAPLYPGSGLKSQGNCLNYPLKSGTCEKEYLKVLKSALFEIKQFSPDILAVSAGFDTYENDPLTNIGLEKSSYSKIANLIAQTSIPAFSVLEGGYSADLKECIYQFLQGLS